MTAQQQPHSPGVQSLRRRPRQPEHAGAQRITDHSRSSDTLSWATNVISEACPGLSVSIRTVRVLRDGTKRLVVATLTDGVSLVLKQYANDRGAWTQLWMNRLCDAGFAPPNTLGVTPARGWSGSHSTLVADMAPEHSWTTWLLAPEGPRTAAAEAAADWLSALQSFEISLPDRSHYRAADEMVRHVDELTLAFPEITEAIARVGGAIRAQLYDSGDLDDALPVPSHGDLHPNNLHIANNESWSVMAIDLDTAGLRRPAYDVGYAIAQLLIVSWMRTGSFHAGASAAMAFWRRWTPAGAGRRDAGNVGAESARALLQSLHFELITYRNGRTDLLNPWLAVARSMLTDGVSHTLHTLSSREVIAS